MSPAASEAELAMFNQLCEFSRSYYSRHSQVIAAFLGAVALLGLLNQNSSWLTPTGNSAALVGVVAVLGLILFSWARRLRNLAIQHQAAASRIAQSWPVCGGKLPPGMRPPGANAGTGEPYLTLWDTAETPLHFTLFLLVSALLAIAGAGLFRSLGWSGAAELSCLLLLPVGGVLGVAFNRALLELPPPTELCAVCAMPPVACGVSPPPPRTQSQYVRFLKRPASSLMSKVPGANRLSGDDLVFGGWGLATALAAVVLILAL